MSRATNEAGEVIQTEKKKKELPVDENGKRIVTKMTALAWDILLEHMADMKLTQAQIAEKVGSHPVYVSRVMSSPCFKQEKTQILRQRIHDRMNTTLEKGADRMDRIFDSEDSSDAVAVEAFKAVAKVAGLDGGGQQQAPAAGNGVTVNLGVTPEMIAEANARRRERIFEGQATEVKRGE